MSWIDDIISGAWDLVFGTEVEGLQGIFDFLLNLPQTLAEMFSALMMLLTYPFVCLMNVARDTFDHLWYIIATFFNIPIDFYNAAATAAALIFPSAPPVWMWLLFSMISIRISIVVIRWIWAIIP